MAYQPAENSKDPARTCLPQIPDWNGDKHEICQLYALHFVETVLPLGGSACQAAQPVLLEEGLNTKCFKSGKGVCFVCFVFLERKRMQDLKHSD